MLPVAIPMPSITCSNTNFSTLLPKKLENENSYRFMVSEV